MRLSEISLQPVHKDLIGLTINKVKIETKVDLWAGNFWCNRMYLQTLNGAPKEIQGDFDCANNNLKSLEGGPNILTGEYYCNNNEIETLEGFPSKVSTNFLYGSFNIRNNKLTNLKNIHKYLKFCGGSIFAEGNPIKSHVLGVLKIDGLRKVEIDNKEVEVILNKYLSQKDKNIYNCQEELIEAGFEEFAQL